MQITVTGYQAIILAAALKERGEHHLDTIEAEKPEDLEKAREHANDLRFLGEFISAAVMTEQESVTLPTGLKTIPDSC